MPVDLKETRLPGVGVKYTFKTASGGRIAVILHIDGQREIYYYRRSGDDDPAAVIELHDDEARQLGAIIGGAYERPKIVEDLEMALGELHIEWIPVPDTSPAIGMSLADARLRARTGVTVIAILREPEPVIDQARGGIPATLGVENDEQQVIPVLGHLGDQASAGLGCETGLDAFDTGNAPQQAIGIAKDVGTAFIDRHDDLALFTNQFFENGILEGDLTQLR